VPPVGFGEFLGGESGGTTGAELELH
jgi:hypothetical protein